MIIQLNRDMFDQIETRRLAAEHQLYLNRIIPIIRHRLASRGSTTELIDRYISELPKEHFKIALARLLRGS